VAFSAFWALSSRLVRSAYESRVREKEVRDAEIWPVNEAGAESGEEESVVRSLRREVDCLRAVLKRVFCYLLEAGGV